MEKGTVSALWNEIISNEVTIATARFWWLHRCLLPLLGKCWLRGRLGVSNAKSHCAVNKIQVLPREEGEPSAAEQFCSKRVDCSLLRQQEFQALSPLSLQQHLHCHHLEVLCLSHSTPVTQRVADILSYFSPRKGEWMSLLLCLIAKRWLAVTAPSYHWALLLLPKPVSSCRLLWLWQNTNRKQSLPHTR